MYLLIFDRIENRISPILNDVIGILYTDFYDGDAGEDLKVNNFL